MGDYPVTRRSCLFGAMLVPVAGFVAALGLNDGWRLSVLGNLNGDEFVAVPKEQFAWMICQGWKVSDQHFDKDGQFRSRNGWVKFERTKTKTD